MRSFNANPALETSVALDSSDTDAQSSARDAILHLQDILGVYTRSSRGSAKVVEAIKAACFVCSEGYGCRTMAERRRDGSRDDQRGAVGMKRVHGEVPASLECGSEPGLLFS